MCEVVDNVKFFDLSESGMLQIGTWLQQNKVTPSTFMMNFIILKLVPIYIRSTVNMISQT